MKILTAEQIKEADNFTIKNKPISYIELMERASKAISDWFVKNIDVNTPLLFLIGKGNNGGDGLAVARLLHQCGYKCSLNILFDKESMTDECRANLERLPSEIEMLSIDDVNSETIIVDCLLGTGVVGELKEPLVSLIDKISSLPNDIISIDLPSGLKTEFGNRSQNSIKADITLALEFPKLVMLLPESGNACGRLEVLSIGLSKDYIENTNSSYYYVTRRTIEQLIKKRNKFAHKGTYGHALLICGSKGMAGAAALATGGALRSGCGLVTIHMPAEDRFSVQVNCPSALFSLDEESYFSELPHNLSKYAAIGIGCGLGRAAETVDALKDLLSVINQPVVLDADALNIVADNYNIRKHIPAGSILTPHLGELQRLVGEWSNEEEKLMLVRRLSANTNSVVVVKGAHTMICLPNGDCYFNSTGNSGMAKGGSGDVLTGYITGLLARGYSSKDAALIGVYVHGLAGDRAAQQFGEEAMNSRDLVDHLYFDKSSNYKTLKSK